MPRSFWLLLTLAVFYQTASAQTLQRELGEFDLKLGTTQIRSMAQGLVTPSKGSLDGGLDLSHQNGLYFGQWTSNSGTSADDLSIEMDTYAGYKHQFSGSGYGYEFGLINYEHITEDVDPSREFYSGISLFGTRLGAAFSNDPGRRDTSVYADLGTTPLLGIGLSMRYGNHRLDDPLTLANGEMVQAYNDWSVNLSRSWAKAQFNFSYTGTSLRGEDCTSYSGHNAYCDTALLLRASHPLF
ncbi:uncharacterized protein (TIGR02001 family) [Pseudomonas duriflava]|uniref:Uncharacterized protein (TIGR02001 family) n=1 Tax=Pseudomonas duriflava TaxID=459528 RepID=A0A562Q2Q2_9PSED|nr:TorF family putative porin [Pseudomonas duriflava]TWI50965.1 uncharacterized protein (TIGR02001 family) [Pseudomonas duriflava]